MERKYRVFLLDSECKINDTIPDDGICIFPDSTSPADVTAHSFGERKYEVWEISLLLGFIYRNVFGYPCTEISVDFDNKLIKIEIFDTPHGFCGLNVDKCKLLFTSCYTAHDLTEHTIYTVSVGEIYRIIPVKNPEAISVDIFSALRIVKGLPLAVSTVVLSDTNLFCAANKFNPYAVVGAAKCILKNNDGEVTLFYNNAKFVVSVRDETATLLTSANLLKINKYNTGEWSS